MAIFYCTLVTHSEAFLSLTPLNILTCTTAGGSGYLECAKQESGQDILTHEAKHNKILTPMEMEPFQELLVALQS